MGSDVDHDRSDALIRLRPHHLLCSLTFVGEGYSEAFVANFRDVLARIASGEPITIVSGPDDVCEPLVRDAVAAHCVSDEIVARDAAAVSTFEADPVLRPLLAGGSVDPERVRALRAAFSRGSIRDACDGCSWNALCTGVAASDYAGAILPG